MISPGRVLRPVHEHAVRQVEVDPHLHAEDAAGGLGFLLAFFEAAAGGGFAAGQVDDGDAVALVDELGEGAAAEDFQVVGVWGDGDDIHRVRVGHGRSPRVLE